MSACLRFFYTISIESINHTHFFTLKFSSYFVKKISCDQDRLSQRNHITYERHNRKSNKEIKQRVIEACKNDSGHTMKLCADSE